MKKKVLATVLAASMVMGMSLNAFAADPGPIEADKPVVGVNGAYAAEVKGSSEVTVPIINVSLPTNLSTTVINPYSMEAKLNLGTEESPSEIVSTDQILSAVYTISSKSNIDLNVSIAGLTAKPSSGSKAVIATTAPTDKVTTNSVFVYLELSNEAATWQDGYIKGETQLIAGTNATKANVVKLEAVEIPDPEDLSAVTASEAFFKFAGAVAPNPTKPWAAADKIDLSVKFSFAPIAVSESV